MSSKTKEILDCNNLELKIVNGKPELVDILTSVTKSEGVDDDETR